MQRAFNVVEKSSSQSSTDSELDGFLPEGGESPAPPAERSRLPLIAGGVAAVLVLAAVGWFVSGRMAGGDTGTLRIESVPAASDAIADAVDYDRVASRITTLARQRA